MKLRIKDDSIRLRLTQTEVTQMAETGRVEATMHVTMGRRFRYALAADDTDGLRADFAEDTLTVFVPTDWVGPWATSEQVGFEGAQEVGAGRSLALLVEKDFECLHKRPDEDDAFPHPLAKAQASSDDG